MALAWNPHGLAIQVKVTGKTKPCHCKPDAMLSGDCVQVWIDTRDTQNQHRASRFCHQFVGIPIGAGTDGTEPVVRQLPVGRAREDAPEVDPESLLAESTLEKDGYRLALWFPKESLHGFDPAPNSRIGFYVSVNDTELGKQALVVGDDFPYDVDPSQWISLQLAE
ncbi:hypothetical protein SH668x_002542 [Planctomicrobium sp. SH668]|uniref:hypothetical protein n=1 Tax=Planctomicrobium sp. SH668 TaxID=3448126 RepID=UPI003F5BD65A